ncbi:hypothetical protein [Lactococcus garvieae]|uniref:Uncharacterized protein n=1 Tax=Lactococcus garvieae TaxID=1363 RepID=A0AA46TX55_9LACT|nr:hypothetical protein [Lactococcus garvieae]UYT10700.1 hypothetical protein OF801_01805 [Lactococcus garvieae]UYT12742.1 hypothetical protein OF800_01805 [Lactococcus garvieae]
MKANKKITGEFTLSELGAVQPFQGWLNEMNFDYAKKGMTYKIANLTDELFDNILIQASEFDAQANDQMDLFEQAERKDVTEEKQEFPEPNTIDGDFEEV